MSAWFYTPRSRRERRKYSSAARYRYYNRHETSRLMRWNASGRKRKRR